MALFTPEELDELRCADQELDETFCQTQAEIEESRKRDKLVKYSRKDNKAKKIAEYQKAYREANREKYNAYMRDYLKKRRLAKKGATV